MREEKTSNRVVIVDIHEYMRNKGLSKTVASERLNKEKGKKIDKVKRGKRIWNRYKYEATILNRKLNFLIREVDYTDEKNYIDSNKINYAVSSQSS